MLLAIDIQEPLELVRAYAEDLKLTFPMLLDETSAVAQVYRARSIPYTLFIDRQGVVRARHIGPLDEKLLKRYIEDIL